MIDGVIKYSINHKSAESPEFLKYRELEELRSRLFALGFIGQKDEIGYGNISTRRDESGTFFITATQTGNCASLADEFYTYISAYDFSNFSVTSQGKHQPSSEALSHAMIYNIHPEITAVIHIHSLTLWEFMKKNGALATSAEYGTAEMVSEIAALYDGLNPFNSAAFVMKGHSEGIMTFGKTISEAELQLYRILNSYLEEKNSSG
ncbi:MAG: class II aldolase/adducin family protein [Campylobacterota bacterium]|nr:class II aldolase/adducin family protein [Campylobacterota bacterium]